MHRGCLPWHPLWTEWLTYRCKDMYLSASTVADGRTDFQTLKRKVISLNLAGIITSNLQLWTTSVLRMVRYDKVKLALSSQLVELWINKVISSNYHWPTIFLVLIDDSNNLASDTTFKVISLRIKWNIHNFYFRVRYLWTVPDLYYSRKRLNFVCLSFCLVHF